MKKYLFALLLALSGCGNEERLSDLEYDVDLSLAKAIECGDKISDLRRDIEDLQREITSLHFKIEDLEKK